MVFKKREPKPISSEPVTGNWQCSECGKEITELPFAPSQDRPIYCKDCWSKKRDARGPRRNDFGPRKMIQGNWTCSECGKEITEMPFEPRGDSPLYCRECWGKRRDRG